VTDALIRRGVAQDRLVLVEYSPEFCQLLKRRFPKATIIQGDAYDLTDTLSGILAEPAAATVSSLPLFTKPMDERRSLLEGAQELMHPDAPFIQFTYAMVPPIPARSQEYRTRASNRIWRNLPPARVWVYTRTAAPKVHSA
jgi:phosphatidylethanolamine/phosphatidyl-N-methylethanolamine N-methyltransferase